MEDDDATAGIGDRGLIDAGVGGGLWESRSSTHSATNNYGNVRFNIQLQ